MTRERAFAGKPEDYLLTTIAESATVVHMADDLIGTTEAAKRCAVDRTTFFRWVQLGRIQPKVKMPGATGAMLFDPADVDALIAAATPKGGAA